MVGNDKAKDDKLAEVQGIALATFSLAINTLQALKKSGTLSQSELNEIVSASLLVLQRSEMVSETSVHSARAMLSEVAKVLGVPTKPIQ